MDSGSFVADTRFGKLPAALFRWLGTLFFCGLLTCAASSPAFSRQGSTVFDTLKHLPEAERIAAASIIYKTNFRKSGPAQAEEGINSLVLLARSLQDKKLECAAYEFKADYYSVNHGFNTRSLSYYDKAIQLAESYGLTAETGIYLHKKGTYYAIFRKNTEACRYFLRSRKKFEQAGFANVPGISWYLGTVADFYYDLGDYVNTRSLIADALKYGKPTKREVINMTNTLGLVYRNGRDFQQAFRYFRKSVTLAVAGGDSVWIAIAQGNIGSVYFLQKKYAEALPFLEKDYKVSLKYGEPVNAAAAMIRIVRISFDRGQIAEAERQLAIAERLIAHRKDLLGLWIDVLTLRSELSEKRGDLQASLTYRKRKEQAKDSLAKRDNIAAVERVRLQWETENYLEQMSKLETRAELEALRRNIILIILFFLGIFSLVFYNWQRQKAKRHRELLESDRRRLDEELKNAGTELLRYTENLQQQNALVESFKNEAGRLREIMDHTKEQEIVGSIENKLLQTNIMTDAKWAEFKGLFVKVHKDFFVHLREKFPNLTETDTRLLALIRLRLGNREMANMLGVTVEGIKKAKQRLRKKMALADRTLEGEVESL